MPPVRDSGVCDVDDSTNVKSGGNGGTGIPLSRQTNYNGIVTPGPDVTDVSSLFPSNLQTPSQLDNLAQAIIANADVVISPAGGTAYGYDLTPLLLSGSNPTGMAAANPMTVVVNRNFDLAASPNTGFGVLIVTGIFNYDPDSP